MFLRYFFNFFKHYFSLFLLALQSEFSELLIVSWAGTESFITWNSEFHGVKLIFRPWDFSRFHPWSFLKPPLEFSVK